MPHFPASSSEQLKAELIARIPRLRAFAMSLCGNTDRAEDLVQETLVKAWGHLELFVEGSNLGALAFYDPAKHLFFTISQAKIRSFG